jgi:hypothetical protein
MGRSGLPASTRLVNGAFKNLKHLAMQRAPLFPSQIGQRRVEAGR